MPWRFQKRNSSPGPNAGQRVGQWVGNGYECRQGMTTETHSYYTGAREGSTHRVPHNVKPLNDLTFLAMTLTTAI